MDRSVSPRPLWVIGKAVHLQQLRSSINSRLSDTRTRGGHPTRRCEIAAVSGAGDRPKPGRRARILFDQSGKTQREGLHSPHCGCTMVAKVTHLRPPLSLHRSQRIGYRSTAPERLGSTVSSAG
ncbi:unnamed protein product [Merluccius merluccius]